MAKEVTPRTYFLIVAMVFVAMVVVTLAVFLAVQRAAHHLPGARPDLSTDRSGPADTVIPDSPRDAGQQPESDHSGPRTPSPRAP